jgi:glycerol-3-phosphate acyltransferase PlsY
MTMVGLCLLAYLAGSIPFGYLFVRAATGREVQTHGSHGTGAINAARVAGPWIGLATLAADAGKAAAVVLAAATAHRDVVTAAAAFLAVAGHVSSPWFAVSRRARAESKGVACALGVMLGLAGAGVLPWPPALLPLGLWLLGLVAPRLVTGRWYWVSPVTMGAALFIPVAVSLARPPAPYLVLSAAMAALILAKHKGNIARLRAGTEPRWGEKIALAEPARGGGAAP